MKFVKNAVLFLMVFSCWCQTERQYLIHTLAFYNVENLFDTINDPKTFDDARTPKGRDNWTSAVYHDKLHRLASVISKIGFKKTRTAPTLIGLAEVENLQVLKDLIRQPQLKRHNYGVVHFDSPDERGIDVALLFKKDHFVPNTLKTYSLEIENEKGHRDRTRDILVVDGYFEEEKIVVLVNHWPSRSGGAKRSEHRRIAAAKLTRKIIDSIFWKDQQSKLVCMGDFNDDPDDKSIYKILRVQLQNDSLKDRRMYNAMSKLFKKQRGSLAFRDRWFLFDQIFLSTEWYRKDQSNFWFWKAEIYTTPELINSRGRYKGYPKRSFTNGRYDYGYSDHFPVYFYIIKRK